MGWWHSILHYKYRATAFSGVRSYSGLGSGGTRLCSVVACTGATIDTCGFRFEKYIENTTAIFEELTIIATAPTPVLNASLQADDSLFFVVSAKSSIMPLETQDYDYSYVVNNDVTTHTLTLKNRNAELYSFAVWGRDFTRDGLQPDPPIEQEYDSETDSSITLLLSPIMPIFTVALILRNL